MKQTIHALFGGLALMGLVLVGTGCDECVDYCTMVGDCYVLHMEGDWEDYGYDDYEDFLDKCDDVHSGQSRIAQTACRVAKRQYECDEDSYDIW